MRIGLYQSNIIWENKEKNIEKLKKLLSVNKDEVDIVLLPEMSFTGFSMNTIITGEENDETKDIISKLCIENSIAIGFGWVKNKNDSENHYTVIDKTGKTVLDYIKIHPFSFSGEKDFFVGGDRVSLCECFDFLVSTAICYDLRFPELFRIASKTAHIIIVPASWPKSRNDHWEVLLRARAIENQIYIIGINCVGKIGGIEYCGNSCIISPDGTVLVSSYGSESLIKYEIVDDVWDYRDRFPTYRDRKDTLYYYMDGENNEC